jgi:cytochrome c oxidase assembly factor CtaG/cytochrome c2
MIEPGLTLVLAVTAGLYARGARETLHRSTRAKAAIKREIIFFSSGLVVLASALVSPLHELGERLFSAHMIQHELLMAIAAPLLVLGNPVVPLAWSLPDQLRRPVARLFTIGVPPLAAFLLHSAAIWIWHFPPLYDASVSSEAIHAAQHLSFLGTALLFWWSLFQTRGHRGNEGAAILYLFLTAIHTTLLGALLTVSDTPFYSVYSETASRIWGLTRIEDQQLGGIIMWIPGGMVYLFGALFLMLRSLRESGLRVAKREAVFRTAALVLVVLMLGCMDHRDAEWADEMTGGSTDRGKDAIRSYGCMSCHSIPGIQGATARVGPPLGGVASRSYIAGVMSNTPEHMIQWLRNPPGIDSKTVMPNMNVTERDARDIAAYLYTLK